MTRALAFVCSLIVIGFLCLAQAQVPVTGAGKGAPGGGGAAATWTATDAPANQDNGLSSVTFSNVNIGTASSDRIVVVGYTSTVSVATGMTIDGGAGPVSATKQIEQSTAISGLQIWSANVPTGTTATIVVTAGGGMSAEAIVVGKLTGVNASPTATGQANNGASDPSNAPITVPSGGFGIAVIVSAPASSGTWSSATQDWNTNINSGGLTITMAHTGVAGSQTPSYSGLGGASSHYVTAAWGP